MRTLAAFALPALLPAPAWACTLCHSRSAEDVRAAVFGPDFWATAAALGSPAPVLLAAVLLVRRYSP